MISLLITSYQQTESEIKEKKTTKLPWFLDCHQLLLSMFCRIVILSWTSALHRKEACHIVKYSILKQNYRTCLKMEIASYVYWRNKLVSQKKVSKVASQTSFLYIPVFLYKRKSLWAFKIDRLIPLVPHTSATKVTKIMQFLLI